MLILNNGVPKSGTTWIQKILISTLEPEFPSESWANHWINPSVDPSRLEDYFRSLEWQGKLTLLKTHILFSEQYKFLLHPEVKVIVSHRGLPDSVLSYYHHQRRLNHESTLGKSKDDWLEHEGRRFAMHAIEFKRSWSSVENALLIGYEDMLKNPAKNIMSIMNFLNVDCSEDEADDIADKTKITKIQLRQIDDNSHVRTAGMSMATRELSPSLYKDLLALQALADSGYVSGADQNAFFAGRINPPLRTRLKRKLLWWLRSRK
jgi:hypothetical protein